VAEPDAGIVGLAPARNNIGRRIIPRGLSLLDTIDPHWSRELVLRPVPRRAVLAPRLAVERTGTLRQFFSSLTALIRGPMPPKEFLGKPFFRDCWIERKFPTPAFAAAIVFQALLIRFPPPIWNLQSARTLSTEPLMELTWYGPIKDFPLTMPAVRAPKPAPRNNATKPTPQRSVDAFHPRQTILSEPLHPNHPRQTLIQPKAPQEPPKILPALPNIVQLAAAQPERPKAKLTADQLAALRPKTPASLAATNAAAPEITTMEKQPGPINIASSSQGQPKPLLLVNSMSAPRAARQRGDTNAAAPDVGGRSAESETLIALSATPAPVAPPPAMPAGNLSARVSISPDGPKPGAPGAAAFPGGERRGPEGIFISGGNIANTSPSSGLSIGAASRAAGNPLPSRPVPRPRIAPEGSGSLSSDAAAAAEASPKLGVAPQDVLGAKHVYTLHVNMPNLTSATGSWILNFAELRETDPGPSIRPDPPDLAGPVPLKKVDPKYPPELRAAHVDGEVVLYAIIRKDGSVDSIQLVKSIDPRLDANAMEALAQWKFRAAEKHGEPIDLEAVVHIPFRSRAPSF
jgi:TonB family protein